ncbi:MAG: transport-associated protein [Deltaproteobacteria bacterium]|nr:transport-associated protein [Deltaproteobacteria bacterium]
MFWKSLTSVVLVLLILVGASGCQKEEGPAEKAGKKMDNAMEQAGQKIEEAGDKIKEATDK